ncbi:MAG TPA: head GIN domain-containing protein [Flavisolibacter sp.]|nr:head GIN domain-containing protein [Flavisolibacter sp.]
MKRIFALAAMALFFFSACTKDRISGSGAISTDNRNVANFVNISTNGATNVQIVKGAAFSVQVKGYSNLLPYFETVVRNNTLELGYRDGTNVKNDNLEVFVTMPVLEGARVSGSADIDVKGTFVSNRMNLFISGSGNIDVESGTVQLLDADVSGSGNIRAFGVTADRAEIAISGSGMIETKVMTHLKANISGSGSIYYKGSPTVESFVSGSGKLVHRP